MAESWLNPSVFTPDSDEVIRFLRKTMQYQEICQTVLGLRVIEKAALEREVLVRADEIQAAADQFRRLNRLEKSADTLSWLAAQQMTPEDWEAGIRDRILAEKLAMVMFGAEVEKTFAENRLNFDRVSLYQIGFTDEKLAQEIFYQIEEQEVSFYMAAHIYDVDQQRRSRCGYEGVLYRWTLPSAIAAAIFAGEPGQVAGPIAVEKAYYLVMMEQFLPAELTDELRQELLDGLFQQWLQGELNYWMHNQL